MNGILKDELGFQGFVQSDWLAQRAGVASALAGLDVTMPGDGLKWQDGKSLWGPELTKAVLNGSVPMERLDDMVTRVVASWYQLGQDDTQNWPLQPPHGDGGPNFSSWTDEEVGLLHPGSPTDNTTGVVNKFINVQGKGDDFHGNLVRKIAAEGTVLVKNDDDILPLDRNGYGKGQKKQGRKFRVAVFGEDARLNPDGINACKDRGCNEGTLASGWGSGAVDYPYLIEPMAALREAFNTDAVDITESLENTLPKDEIVEDQDLCIVFANSDAGEGYMKWDSKSPLFLFGACISLYTDFLPDIRGDRNDLRLQKNGDKLIKNVASRCGNGNSPTIVVIHTVGPVLLEQFISLPNLKAVLIAHLPGQESGNALVDILFGDVNPSGRLPYTIAKREEDYGPTSKIKYLPSPLDGLVPQQNLSEGLYIDHRYFDKQGIAPRYEFGFGLSYTTFELSGLVIEEKGSKTLLAKPPPKGIAPPTYPTAIPYSNTALFPAGFRTVERYIYPWLASTDGVRKHSVGEETELQRLEKESEGKTAASSPIQGGNPDLYTTVLSVSAMVRNTGEREGKCVVQLYISFPKDYVDPLTGKVVDFPVRVLRGFEKVELKARDEEGKGEGMVVKLNVTRKDLSYWDVVRQEWVLPDKGEFGIEVGFSSWDLPLKGSW
jgi:beta-glucosidase